LGAEVNKEIFSVNIYPNLHEGLRHITESARICILTETVAIGDAKVDLPDDG